MTASTAHGQYLRSAAAWQHGAVTLPTHSTLTDLADAALRACGAPGLGAAGEHAARSPITGTVLGGVDGATSVDDAVARRADGLPIVAHDTGAAAR